MGYGIEARYSRCGKFWDKHLENTKEFIRGEISAGSESLLVLGAGRLFDYPVEHIPSSITLVDADPAALRISKKKLGGKAECICTELTGTLSDWQRSLAKCIKSNPTPDILSKFLRDLELNQCPALPRADTVISLNLLGQIPVYWREFVGNQILQLGVKRDDHDNFPPLIEESVIRNSLLLQEQHFELLKNIGCSKVILLTDRQYHFYEKDHAVWESFPALYAEIPGCIGEMKLRNTESWFWHIAPQGIEHPEYGVIHEVVACTFRS